MFTYSTRHTVSVITTHALARYRGTGEKGSHFLSRDVSYNLYYKQMLERGKMAERHPDLPDVALRHSDTFQEALNFNEKVRVSPFHICPFYEDGEANFKT